MFTDRGFRELAAAAMTIDERLGGSCTPADTPIADKTARRRFDQWMQSASDGDPVIFAKYLASMGHDEESILPFVGDVSIEASSPPPDWTQTFRWVSAAIAEGLKSDPNGWSLHDPDHPVPFEDLLAPIAITASQRRRSAFGRTLPDVISNSAELELDRAMLRRLAAVSAPTLFETFRSWRDADYGSPVCPRNSSNRAYKDFVRRMREGGARAYFRRYPVVARLLSVVTHQWMETTTELAERLSSDAPLFSQLLSGEAGRRKVTHIECNLSDPHDGGRGVSILTFEDGQHLVYKPRDIGIDVAWKELIGWLDERGAPLSLAAPGVIGGDGYGWVEWVQAHECESESEVRRYFQRSGALLCLIWMLGGSDFHHENVISVGDQPVLVDLETLLHPRNVRLSDRRGPRSALSAAAKMLQESVLATGFLPLWTIVPGKRIAGVGALNPPEPIEYVRDVFRHVNTDAMERVSQTQLTDHTHNLPVLYAEVVSSKGHHNDVANGFTRMYKFLLEHISELAEPTGPLARFRGMTVRFLPRPTQLYALLLERALADHHTQNGVEWSLHFHFLARFSRWEEPDDPYRPLLAVERAALSRLDIPRFTATTDSTVLEAWGAEAIPDYFRRPAFEQVRSRVASLGSRDLERQLGLIAQAFGAASPARSRRTASHAHRSGAEEFGDFSARALQEASVIAARLEETAIVRGGGAAWTGCVPLVREQGLQLEVVGPDLYSGIAGITLFLAAFEAAANVRSYHDVALAALAPWRRELLTREGGLRLARRLGIGAGTGLTSIVYVLAHSAALLDEPDLLSDACQVASLIDARRIAADSAFDVLSGAAGAIVALIALFERSEDDSVLERAILCGNHLLNNQVDGTWPTAGAYRMSFAHGVSGISMALLRLHRVTADARYQRAAEDAIRWERQHLRLEDHEVTRASDGGAGAHRLCQWCHGAPGLALARLEGLSTTLEQRALREEIDRALEETAAFPVGGPDHVCCGNFGRVETLLAGGLALNKGDLVDTARHHAVGLVSQARARGSYMWRSGTDAQNPGFFTGISGIGYELLRCAYPTMLPPVLRWE